MSAPEIKLLLSGHDTIQCAYNLMIAEGCSIDFDSLMVSREMAKATKSRDPVVVELGGVGFLLEPNGSKSGYPFVINNPDFRIEFGPNNAPSFYVTFRSEALWREGAQAMHQRFMQWAESVGLFAHQPEGLSRVDFTFDYSLPEVDFDEDCFISLSSKDAKHRENGKAQTFQFGKDDIVLRIYDKVAEIKQQSSKTWFYKLWGQDSGVWRIEWQTRKGVLRRFGIRTFDDLQAQQGDLLRYLAEEHTTLRLKSEDSNRSRWPLHPLWVDLQQQINQLDMTGIYREVDPMGALDEHLMRIAVSLNGYAKRIATICCLQEDREFMSQPVAIERLRVLLNAVHNPLDWRQDLEKRIKHMRLGKW